MKMVNSLMCKNLELLKFSFYDGTVGHLEHALPWNIILPKLPLLTIIKYTPLL